jgi:hypothetical protein
MAFAFLTAVLPQYDECGENPDEQNAYGYSRTRRRLPWWTVHAVHRAAGGLGPESTADH